MVVIRPFITYSIISRVWLILARDGKLNKYFILDMYKHT